MKCLIVDDDFQGRLIIQKMIGNRGECHQAANGKEAVLAFRQAQDAGEPYALVLLDVMMPEMDGLTALSEMRQIELERGRERPNAAKIIMLTAVSDERTVRAAALDSCDDYILKPFSGARLLKSLRDFGLI